MSRSRILLALLGVLLAVIALIQWGRFKEARAVADLRSAVVGEITIRSQAPPKYLPASMDKAVGNWLERKYGPSRVSRAYARLRSYFRGPMDTVRIWDLKEFREDFGAPLARLPHVRELVIMFDRRTPPRVTEAQLKELCVTLRSMSRLEELTLWGDWVTDDSIAPLAGHPTLREISFIGTQLTSRGAATLSTMPSLAEFFIGDPSGVTPELSAPEQAAIKAALPAVKVYILEPDKR